MKLNRKKIKKYILLNLYLIKYKYYNTSQFYESFLSKIESEIKLFLKIIYSYHTAQKKILFLVSKGNKFFSINPHQFVSKTVLRDGILTNKSTWLNDFKNKQQVSNVLTKTPDLVVIFDTTIKDLNFVNEVLKFNIPVILMGYEKTLPLSNKFIYRFNFKLTKKNSTFIYFLINSILKKK